MEPLMQIVGLGWVVGPRYDPKESKRLIGLRAVKGWLVINIGLDDTAEELVTVRADTPELLLAAVIAFEAVGEAVPEVKALREGEQA